MSRSPLLGSRAALPRRVSHDLDTLYAEGVRVALRCREACRVVEEARAALADRPRSSEWLVARSYCASARKPRREAA